MVSSKALPIASIMLCSVLFVDAFAGSSPEPIKLTQPALQDVSGGGWEATAGQKLVIATNVRYDFGEQDYNIIVLFEARDGYGITQFLAWQSFMSNVGGEVQVAVSWVPERAGTYELRTFAITNDWEHPQVLSGVAISEVTIASPLCTGIAECFVGTVTNIVDGDTLDIEGKRIRLALVNTPEIGEEGYNEAKKFTAQLCPVGSEVIVDQDDGQLVDVYERVVAKVICGNENKILNAELLYNDHAGILSEYCEESEFSSEVWALSSCGVVTESAPVQNEPDDSDCDPSYPDVCIPPPPPDLDCGEISHRNFRVLQPDLHRFDNDKDGIGCES